MATKIKIKTIKKEVGKGRQSLELTEIIEIENFKLKVTIKSDSYDFQCYAKIEIFNDFKWNLVDKIHYSQMETKDSLKNKLLKSEKATVKHAHFFKEDRDKLVNMAKEIIL